MTGSRPLVPRALRGLLWLLFALFWVGGLVSYGLWGGPPPGSEWTAPTYLATAAVVVVASARARRAALLLAAGALGFAAEVLGVATGIPFGGYAYTAVLAPLVAGVPLVLAAAWIVLAAWAEEAVRRLFPRLPPLPAAAVGGLWMTAADLMIDPLAAGPLGYWRWDEPGGWYGVPTANFLGWWLVGSALVALLGRVRAQEAAARAARRVGLATLGFFVVLAVVSGLPVPALIGVLLMAVDLVARRVTGAPQAGKAASTRRTAATASELPTSGQARSGTRSGGRE